MSEIVQASSLGAPDHLRGVWLMRRHVVCFQAQMKKGRMMIFTPADV